MVHEKNHYPEFSVDVRAFCESSSDPFVHTAPQWLSGFFALASQLPDRYGWRYTDVDSLSGQISGEQDARRLNKVFWTDQARNVEAYAITTTWRGAELLKPAVNSFNAGELVAVGVLARSALELAASFLHHARTVDELLCGLEFPPGTVVTSTEFEERVVRMLWGTRLGQPQEHLKQGNVLTVLQKLSKNPLASDLSAHYEYLCEIAHPNVIGNSRFWSHVERKIDDGSELRVIERVAAGDSSDEIRAEVLWSLAWSAESMRNAFTLTRNALGTLLTKLSAA